MQSDTNAKRGVCRTIDYLARLCRHWGGALVLMMESEFRALPFADRKSNGLTQAPDGDHAIDWPHRRVIAIETAVNPGALIHEMGHSFLHEGAPKTTDETDWLGWEIALARRARCYQIWSKQNADYELGDICGLGGVAWGILTATEQRRVIAERINHAMTLGIVSQDGVPLCTRRS